MFACGPPVADALGLDDDARALRIRVLRTNGGVPYAFSVIHIPRAYARALPADWRQRVDKESFVGLVVAANGSSVHRAIQVAQAVGASGEVSKRLGVAPNTPLLLLERSFLAREGAVLEHAQIYCRPDRYRQITEFRASDAGRASQRQQTEATWRPGYEEKNAVVRSARTVARAGAGGRSILLTWLYLSALMVPLGAVNNAQSERQTRKDSTLEASRPPSRSSPRTP